MEIPSFAGLSAYILLFTPLTLSAFDIPKPTIITAPGFHSTSHAPGTHPDDPTKSSDGKPLSPHLLYASDTYHFLRRLDQGLRRFLPLSEEKRYYHIRKLLQAQTSLDQEKLRNAYIERNGTAPIRDRYYPIAQAHTQLEESLAAYYKARNEIRHAEKDLLAGPIDLDNALSPAGKTYREMLKKAITSMYAYRQSLDKSAARYLKIADRTEYRKNQTVNAQKQSTRIKKHGTQLFIGTKPLTDTQAQGMLWNYYGKIQNKISPIFIAKGEPVEILKRTSVHIPSSGPYQGGTLDVCQVRITSSKMSRNGYRFSSPRTYTGWILSRDLENPSAK